MMSEYHKDTLGSLEEQLGVSVEGLSLLRENMQRAYDMFESQALHYTVSTPNLLEWMSTHAEVRVGTSIEQHPEGPIVQPRLQVSSRLKSKNASKVYPFVLTYKLDFKPTGYLKRAYGKIDYGYFDDYQQSRKNTKPDQPRLHTRLSEAEEGLWSAFKLEERQLDRSHVTFPLLAFDIEDMKGILQGVYF